MGYTKYPISFFLLGSNEIKHKGLPFLLAERIYMRSHLATVAHRLVKLGNTKPVMVMPNRESLALFTPFKKHDFYVYF